MAKAPRPGRVKTRLHPLLGPPGCARLQAALIRNACQVVADAGLRCAVAVDPADAAAELTGLIPSSATVIGQSPGNLGERMRDATRVAFAAGAARVVVLGVDVPTVQSAAIADAVRQLDGGADVVVGPALDGGYYLIGMRRPLDTVFDLLPAAWGGSTVLDDTLAIARRHRLDVRLLEPLTDLDTAADAAMLLADPLLPREIVAVLVGAGRRQPVASR